MKSNKIKSALSAVTTCSLLGIVSFAPMAQVTNAAVLAPVGFVVLTFKAESDTPFSLPLNRPKVFRGQLDTISVNTINIANADFTASELVYADGSQNEKYYLLFNTGTLEGRTFDVTANSMNSITVDQDGDTDIQTLIGAASTDNFEIRPHWTLDTLFPNGAGFPQSTSIFDNGSEIHTKPANVPGINLSSEKIYKYVTDTGWVDTANLLSGQVKDVVLNRNSFFQMRNYTTSAVIKNLVGDVPLTDGRLKLRSNVIKQDSHVAFSFPTDIKLSETGLESSSGFKHTSGQFNSDGDTLWLYDLALTGYNKSASVGYYYVGGLGWIDSSNILGGAVDASTVNLKAGTACFVRKISEVSAETYHHGTALPYNPFAE
ncbi:MAG: hypothetical protein ACJAR1_002287 [Rubritalea sp.]|jgi:uncharacterized protein (TIGR02597 family)